MNLEGSSNLIVSEPNVALQIWDTTINQSVFGFGSYQKESTPLTETYFRAMGEQDLGNRSIEAAIVLSQEAIDIGKRQQGKSRRCRWRYINARRAALPPFCGLFGNRSRILPSEGNIL